MSVGHRARFVLLAAAMTAGAFGGAPAAVAANGSPPVDARVLGTFEMRATVTTAVNVRGEHVGARFTRIWKVVPEQCVASVCQLLRLNRQRSDHWHDHLILHRVGPGLYTGTGAFYAVLFCDGRIYRHGSRVPFRITLTVRRAATIQGISFARRLKATYTNPSRTDATPCPLGPSHDAARYRGHAVTPLPQPPHASFSVQMNARTDTGSFGGSSQPGRGGGRIVSRQWNFGDPRSGAANRSSGEAPRHRFSAPGVYRVSLTVLDTNGLSSTAVQEVTAPARPAASVTDTPYPASDLFLHSVTRDPTRDS